MSEHRATVEWKREGEFVYATYSRMHEVHFESGVAVPGRASPSNIQCHMLWFLHLALEARFVVERYVDEAAGLLERTWMSQAVLRPRVAFSGKAPTDEQHRELHRKAHQKCFIANSIKSEVTVEPSIDHR